jgi:hypothetical protein
VNLSGGGKTKANSVFTSDKITVIESYYRRRPGYYGEQVLEAKSNEDGVIEFAKPSWEYENSNSNTIDVRAEMRAGVRGKYDRFSEGDDFGINWDNVKVIKGNTYPVSSIARSKGFKWNKVKKVWEK